MHAYVLILSSEEKIKVNVSSIKRFDAENHMSTQKYKIITGESSEEEGIILFLASKLKDIHMLIALQHWEWRS